MVTTKTLKTKLIFTEIQRTQPENPIPISETIRMEPNRITKTNLLDYQNYEWAQE